METLGEMAEPRFSSESAVETVDSPAVSTHAGLNMSPVELSTTISRSVVPTCDESLAELASDRSDCVKEEQGPSSGEELSAEGASSLAGDTIKQESLSVIVHPHTDSEHDSELLSPGKISPTSAISVSVAGMIDATDFRALQPEPTYQTLTSVNGRMSPPGFSPGSSYATLTPLQPLPPISTMSDKFAYGHTGNVSGSFTVMQNNGLNNIGLGMGVNSPYGYDKLPSMGMSPPHHYSPNNGLGGIGMPQQHSPLSPQSSYSQNGLNSPQKSMSPNSYDSPYNQRDLVGRASTLSPPSASMHSPPNTIVTGFGATSTSLAASLPSINGLTTITPHTVVVSPHHSPPSLVAPQLKREAVVVTTPSPPKQVLGQQTTTATLSIKTVTPVGGGPTMVAQNDLEEINTKELAQRISAELKRYSIPQAIFAQRVLCRSQGTLSDLLRNPKPWSKLKSGRETFRRMWKWLQEPEFQRMSALRLAAAQIPQRGNSDCQDSDPFLACKRKDEPQIHPDHTPAPKKPRLVFTDLQRRTLQAIFKETKRPSKEMQVTIARQLGLEPTTVGNFFMNARRRSMDKWKDEDPKAMQGSPQHNQAASSNQLQTDVL
ncbi:hepatocyte nuclear factor 6 isoform X2 [Nilaparvata lugens]|uniref:hepatocyte nuclear factor 6 isoform X2 n=1 Tax=Nilaparvata lugens TaxID=108931 RepID=UPI00193EA7B3|nr:hepatocyte nuclear factor 6 isoform X2 [Nilaparvata lugens]